MASILIYYFLISFTCLWTGFLSHALLWRQNQSRTGHTSEKHWIIYAFWGLVVLTLFAQVIQLFVPVNQYTWLAFVITLGILSVFNKPHFVRFFLWIRTFGRESPWVVPASTVLVMFFCVLNAGPTLMDDTESYHIQMIKWIQEYGTVPGLANLHARYGFNSSWFTFSSLFVPIHSVHNFFTMANGVISVWLSLYLFHNFFNATRANKSTIQTVTSLSCLLVFLATIFCWPMLRGNVTTANYDFVTACMIIVLFIEVWKQENTPAQWKSFLPELLTWPVFMFTVRIINFPLLLLSLFALIVLMQQRNHRQAITCSVISLALVLPFLARNVLLSGYMFYPVYQIGHFAVEWKVNPDIARDLVSYIKYFNRVNAAFQPIVETQKLGFPEWIPAWFHYLFMYDKPVLLMGLSGYLLAFIRARFIVRLSMPVNLFLVALVCQLISWFLVAPDPRFVYGPILVGIFLLPFFLPRFFLESVYKYQKLIAPISFCILAALAVYITFKVSKDSRYANSFLPRMLPVPPTRLIKIGVIECRIPEQILDNWNPRCYATDLPCLYKIQPGLSARGKTMSQGFKIKN